MDGGAGENTGRKNLTLFRKKTNFVYNLFKI